MDFSPDKNACGATSRDLADDIIYALNHLKIKRTEKVKSLGSAVGIAGKRNATMISRRLNKFDKRRGRFQQLRCSGVDTSRLLRSGGLAALCYGQESTGVASTVLNGQRSSAVAMLVRVAPPTSILHSPSRTELAWPDRLARRAWNKKVYKRRQVALDPSMLLLSICSSKFTHVRCFL